MACMFKSDLRRAVANTKRGKRATGEQQREILRTVEALEAVDPTPNPARSKLLSGRWSLLYNGELLSSSCEYYIQGGLQK